MNMAASHARGKVPADKIFGANAKAVEAIGKYGKDKVINGTQGVLLDDAGTLVCLPTVEKILRNLSTPDLIGYAPIRGLADYLTNVIDFTLGITNPMPIYSRSLQPEAAAHCTMQYGTTLK